MWITQKKEGILCLGPRKEKHLYKLVLKIEKKRAILEAFLKNEKLWITLLI